MAFSGSIILPGLILQVLTLAQAQDAPWFKQALVGMEVGPTGAQFGIDPHENGYAARFSGTDIVRSQIEIGSEYLVIWAKDSEFAYYDSKVAPKCPGLGERDVLREAVEAAKPHHLPIVAYCVVQGNGYPLRDHPEYKMVGADGKPIERICLNSGYIEHAKAVCAEMLAYGIDGFHVDMLDQGFGPPYGCWCKNCREKFEKEFGQPMPAGVTWDEAWDHMLAFRYSSSERFERTLLEYIRSINPKASVDFNYHGYPPFSWEVGQRPVQHAHVGDFVTAESGMWGFSALNAGLTCQFVRASDPKAPYQVVTTRNGRTYHDQTARPLNDMRWEAFALLSNGAQVTIIDKTPYDGTVDPVAYARTGEFFSEVKAKRAHFGHTPVAEVGLYYSSRTRDWYGRETPGKYEQSFFGLHKAMVYEHIPYAVVLDENVSLELLRTLPVVILADVAILSDKEVQLLRAYVEGGGKLLVTGVSGLHGFRGEDLAESSLADLIGARCTGSLRDNDNFFKLPPLSGEQAALQSDIPSDWAVLAYGPAAIYAPTTATPVGELLKPIRTLRQQQGLEGKTFPSSAGEAVGPAVLVHPIGKGCVVTIAVSPGAAIASEYRTVEARKLLRNAVRFVNPKPEIRIDAPIHVETVASDDSREQVLRVHFVGYTVPPAMVSPNRPYLLVDPVEDVPIYRATVTLQRPFKTAALFSEKSGKRASDLPATRVDATKGMVDMTVNDIHDVLIVEY